MLIIWQLLKSLVVHTVAIEALKDSMKLYTHSPNGLHQSEVRAINALEEGLQDSWHGYASFLINDGIGNGMEIDLLIFTHSRILLVEIKEWKGEIYSDTKTWKQKVGSHEKYHASPVQIKRVHAERIKTLFKDELEPKWGCYYNIDSLVILAGDAIIKQMPEREREKVFTVEEFLKIRKPEEYLRLLPARNENIFNRGTVDRPNNSAQINIFEKWFRCGEVVKPRFRQEAGYAITSEHPLFEHPKQLYKEYKGEHCEQPTSKALMRRWQFEQLANYGKTSSQRANLGLRESRVIRYVGDKKPQLKEDYLMSPLHSIDAEEIDEDLIEVYEHPPLLKRLDSFILDLSADADARADLLRASIAPFAALHAIGVAHRDISLERLWFNEHSKAVLISGLVAARFPESAIKINKANKSGDGSNKSIGDLRALLSSNQIPMPEETFGEVDYSAPRIDVYQLGVLAYQVAFNQRLPVNSDIIEWVEPIADPFDGRLTPWIKKSLEMTPNDRYQDAGEMLTELTKILAPTVSAALDDSPSVMAELSKYETEKVIMADWPPVGTVSQDQSKGRMSYSVKLSDESDAVIRIWTSHRPEIGQKSKNRRLLHFVSKCQTIKSNCLQVPKILDFGFSLMGLFVLQSYPAGETLDVWLENVETCGLELKIALAKSLITAVNKLHDIDVPHGDLKPDNILVTVKEGGHEVLLTDCLDLDLGALPPTNHDYSPLADCSAIEKDRFATYLIVEQIIADADEQTLSVVQEIKKALGEERQCIPVSLEPLRRSLERASKPNIPELSPITLSWPELSCDKSTVSLAQDQGMYYMSLRKTSEEEYRVYISGSKQKLSLVIEYKKDKLALRKAFLNVLSPVEWMQVSQDATNPKNRRTITIKQPLQVRQGPINGEDILLGFLRETELFQRALDNSTAAISNKEERVGEVSSTGVTDIWKALIDAEAGLNPVVTVDERPVKDGKDWRIPIKEDLLKFEFAADDLIQVMSDGEDEERSWRYGNVNLSKSKDGFLVVSQAKGCNRLTPNTQLQLVEKLSGVSWERRNKALNRVLNGESLIPNLARYFDVNNVVEDNELPSLPTPPESLLKRYERLDPSKIAAFNQTLQGRVNVIMGPPGTGKTTLLAYLLDYFNRLPEINRILLVSQSHAAVNEVATRTREVIRQVAESEGKDPYIIEPSMVRLGERDRVDHKLLDVHVEALQSQYRARFFREIEARLQALSPRLGLPPQFVLESAAIYREYGEDLYLFTKASNECIELEDSKLYPEKKLERARFKQASQIRDRLHSILRNKLQHIVDNVDALLASSSPFPALLQHIAKSYGVSADQDGFAGFMSRTRKLVIGTLVGIGKSAYSISDSQYDVVIIDEAGRASASELAMAMQSAKRVILVGDHKQLPPHYENQVVHAVMNKLDVTDEEVRKTDFERAYLANAGVMLDTQYRMAPAIGNLVSDVFYGGKLNTGRKVADEWLGQSSFPWDRTVCWLDTSDATGKEMKIEGGIANQSEVDMICSLLQQLLRNPEALHKLHKWASEDKLPPIGIITGYRRQVEMLRSRLDRDTWATQLGSLVRIDTIDSYQGSENRLVLLSLVRHNVENKTGFMEDCARINVALSRAKERLLIIGSGKMWSKSDTKSPLCNVFRFIKERTDNCDPDYYLSSSETLETHIKKERINVE